MKASLERQWRSRSGADPLVGKTRPIHGQGGGKGLDRPGTGYHRHPVDGSPKPADGVRDLPQRRKAGSVDESVVRSEKRRPIIRQGKDASGRRSLDDPFRGRSFRLRHFRGLRILLPGGRVGNDHGESRTRPYNLGLYEVARPHQEIVGPHFFGVKLDSGVIGSHPVDAIRIGPALFNRA